MLYRTVKMLILLAAIVCCASAMANGAEIRQVELDGSMLIDTGASNYAISSPDLSQLPNNWKCVSVNGNQVTILTSTCQSIVKDSQSLSQDERTKLTSIASRLIMADTIGNPNGSPVNHMGRHSASRFSLGPGSSMRSSRSEGMSMSSFQMNGLSVSKYDERNYSIGKSGLPNGISRLFVSNGDLVTFVYANGRVLMKPISCLDATEAQLYRQLETEVHQAQQQFEINMNQFQQNMQRNMMNMHQGMQQNMQQMQHNMANMFSNSGFPFNGAASQAGFGAGQANAYAGPMFPNQFHQQGVFAGAGPGASSFMAPMAPIPPLPPMAPMPNMAPMQSMMNFGNNFPFRQNNSPFGAAFPFGR